MESLEGEGQNSGLVSGQVCCNGRVLPRAIREESGNYLGKSCHMSNHGNNMNLIYLILLEDIVSTKTPLLARDVKHNPH